MVYQIQQDYTPIRQLFIINRLRDVFDFFLQESVELQALVYKHVDTLETYPDSALQAGAGVAKQSVLSSIQEFTSMLSVIDNYGGDYLNIEKKLTESTKPHILSDAFGVNGISVFHAGISQSIQTAVTAYDPATSFTALWYKNGAHEWESILTMLDDTRAFIDVMYTMLTSVMTKFSTYSPDYLPNIYLGAIKRCILRLRASTKAVQDAVRSQILSLEIQNLDQIHPGMQTIATKWSALSTDWSLLTRFQRAAFNGGAPITILSLTDDVSFRDTYVVGDTTVVPSIYADARPPSVDTSGKNGWVFTNTAPSQKVNWYFVANTTDSTFLVSSLKSFYFIIECASLTSRPFLTIYTKKTTTNPAHWYGTKKTFTLFQDVTDGTDSMTIGKRCLVYFGTDPTTLFPTGQIGSFDAKYNLGLDTTGGTTTFKSNEGLTDINPASVVYLIAISTNSAAAVGTVNFRMMENGYFRQDTTMTQGTVSLTRSSLQSLC